MLILKGEMRQKVYNYMANIGESTSYNKILEVIAVVIKISQ